MTAPTYTTTRRVHGQAQPFRVSCMRPLDVTAQEFFSGPRVRHVQQIPTVK